MNSNLGIELARVTEAAAIAAARLMGLGDGGAAEKAAVEAMRQSFSRVDMDGRVVIGGWKPVCDPCFKVGDKVGTGKGEKIDVAVDPLEGTRIVATGGQNSMAVVVVTEKGGMMSVPRIYMRKLAVGPKARGVIDLTAPPTRNLKAVANALRVDIEDLTVVILDRSRHQELIAEVREAGARIKLIPDGDMSEAISCAVESSGVDLLMGIGGAPEGILSAAALKCLGGEMQGELVAIKDGDMDLIEKAGLKSHMKVLSLDEMVPGENIYFVATGVTDGDLLPGVVFKRGEIRTESVIARSKTGTVRFIKTIHRHWERPDY